MPDVLEEELERDFPVSVVLPSPSLAFSLLPSTLPAFLVKGRPFLFFFRMASLMAIELATAALFGLLTLMGIKNHSHVYDYFGTRKLSDLLIIRKRLKFQKAENIGP